MRIRADYVYYPSDYETTSFTVLNISFISEKNPKLRVYSRLYFIFSGRMVSTYTSSAFSADDKSFSSSLYMIEASEVIPAGKSSVA